MTINNQLHLLNQQLTLYNQYNISQQYQYQQPQIQQPIVQSVTQPKPLPKKLYNIQFDNDGFITDLNTT